MKISKTQLTPAKCALDLGDGSERGLYVNQDYIFVKFGSMKIKSIIILR